jgi:hypothetical protein
VATLHRRLYLGRNTRPRDCPHTGLPRHVSDSSAHYRQRPDTAKWRPTRRSVLK